MKVLMIASEASPFAKVGGIADVVGALPIALARLGIDVRIMLPRYAHLAEAANSELILRNIPTRGKFKEPFSVYRTTLPTANVPVYLIDNPGRLGQGSIYNDQDNADPFSDLSRFLFFSSAAVTAIPFLGWTPDIVHCHDWHTATIPTLLKNAGQNARTVLTIHNIAYQGKWRATEIASFLDVDVRTFLQKADGKGDFNPLLEGILAATMVNTVSPQYAREILTPEFGNGLESALAGRGDRVAGILNGIDTALYDPWMNRSIAVRYDAGSIDRKLENKLALEEQCGFASDANIPIFGFVGRLADQKGIELILKNSAQFAAAGARLVLLGTGLPEIEDRIRKAVTKHPQHIFAKIGFDNNFAQRLYAGSDFVLVPSRFEPCGLVQMIAMRYGTVPVVRSTGGLKDTVPDFDADPEKGLGFAFDAFTPKALWTAVTRAIACHADAPRWRALTLRCLAQDFSWTRSANEYATLYTRCLKPI